jgi:ABC-type sugar transport system ATPase subunit
MAAIQLQDVTKVFHAGAEPENWMGRKRTATDQVYAAQRAPQSSGEVKALDHLDLSIADGETMAIVGPSGCGKSTLLRVVAGLTDYKGRVAYDGQDMRDVAPGDRRIGMVFQDYALYPHFYGKGNLSFFFQVNRAPDEEAEERIRITADMMGFGFKELLRRKPGTLSGGQQQRLAIARALVREPNLFLFDEPLSNLDAKLRSQTRVEIKRLLRRFEITAIYVTHDQTEAMALGDRIAVMRAGRIEQVGAYMAILHDPANAFVAGFLGLPPMNLLPAKVEDGTFRLAGHQLALPKRFAAKLRTDQEILLGIRPEAAQICSPEEGLTSSRLALEGTIEVVEPDFGRNQQTAYMRSGEITYSVTTSLDHRLIQGYRADVCFPEEALYMFDAESEDRIRPDQDAIR